MSGFEAKLQDAVKRHLEGDPDAERLYREIIAEHPGRGEARIYLGFLLQQSGRLEAAASEMEAAVSGQPGRAEWHFSLGMVLARLGKTAPAKDALAVAVGLDPEKYLYRTNLGALFEREGDAAAAESCYLEAARIDPENPDAYFLLCTLYLGLGRHAEARRNNWLGIAASNGGVSRLIQAQALYETGKAEAAFSLLESWRREDPENPVPVHLLCAYRGDATPDRCSEAYVRQTFDAFAGHFDEVLGRLKYRGPALLEDLLRARFVPGRGLRVLDLGCGTGLCASVLRPYATRLEGVDLSAGMIDKALARGAYDRIVQSDMIEFLKHPGQPWDLAVSMDTFIYLGDLLPVMTGLSRAVKPGGTIVFSTESLDESVPYRLDVSGRYRHSGAHVEAGLAAAGFEPVVFEKTVIRMEAGSPIEGHFICAVRNMA